MTDDEINAAFELFCRAASIAERVANVCWCTCHAEMTATLSRQRPCVRTRICKPLRMSSCNRRTWRESRPLRSIERSGDDATSTQDT